MRTSSPSERDDGFTLLEVLIALAIVALASALLLPRLGDLAALERDAAAHRLAGTLTLARERAILGGRALRVALDLDAGRWSVEGSADDAAVATLPPRVRLRAVTVDDTTVTSGVARIDVDPAGDPQPVRIELRDDRGRATSIVLPAAAGAARIVREERG